jgi:cellulose biosynthesis protein BcsQ
MSMTTTSLQSALRSIPENAKESVVNALFGTPLLEALGFQPEEIYPEYNTGIGTVDQAARKTIGDDKFLYTKSNPYLLIELKGRDIDLSSDNTSHQKALKQLKKYLLDSNCSTAQWGIITNSRYLQLFRRHGLVVFPATKCLSIDENNIDKVVALIRKKIENPVKALTVAIYNNKGGVGKTTTTVNLASIIAMLGKRVLAVDFDPNQQDLTSSLGISASKGNVLKFLTERDVDLRTVIQKYSFSIPKKKVEFRFDVIPADQELISTPENIIRNRLKSNTLYRKLEDLKNEYDYIFIDSPPNWRVFSQLAVYAADVVLIPTKHNSLFSLENAATAIKEYIPEVQAKKGDGSPIALPIFFNGERITDHQLILAQKEINSIITSAKDDGFNLLHYFYPKYTKAKKDLHIVHVPSHANIASSAFSRVPAVYREKSAYEYYKSLVKEYFLK